MSAFTQFLSRATSGEALDAAAMTEATSLLLDGGATDVEAASFLGALAARGETADELAAAAAVLRARVVKATAPAGAIDVCGTGGDGARTLNISTAVAFVAAGAGAIVAKHGNRAASSASGSSDVLAALGVAIDVSPEVSAKAFASAGCAFLFAPRHHPDLGRLAALRRGLGVRTIFNLLGPLANPAGVVRQIVGVASPAQLETMAGALARLGAEHAFVLHGADGVDEATLSGDTHIVEVRSGALRRFRIHPSDVGLPTAPTAALRGGDSARNAAALRALLDGERSAYRDAVIFNAALALLVAGKARALAEGAEAAARSIDSGAAARSLRTLISVTQGLA